MPLVQASVLVPSMFMAQLPQLTGVGWQAYAMVAAGLAIIYLLPRLTKAIPSPLVAIVALTALAIVEHWMMMSRIPDAKLWRWLLPADERRGGAKIEGD